MPDKTRELPAVRCGACAHWGRRNGAGNCDLLGHRREARDPVCDKFEERI